MIKRARLAAVASSDVSVPESRIAAGKELRLLLIGLYTTGDMPATVLGAISHWVTLAGGVGVSDFAVKPCQDHNASRKINIALEKEFPEPEYFHQNVPTHEKRASCRNLQSIPIRLPTSIFSEAAPGDPATPDPMSNICLEIDDHPIIRKARANNVPWVNLRTCSLYCDGVQYSKNESVYCFYIRCLRTDEQQLLFTIRIFF